MKKNAYPPIELLETRIAPAGIVTVIASGGNLVLQGDAEANDISITQTALGSIVITGNMAGGSPTQIQLGATGTPAASATVTDINGSLTVRLADGDDALRATAGTGLMIGKNLTIDFGGGTNLADLRDLIVGGNVSLLGGGGAETVLFGGLLTQIGGKFTAKLGNGANGISFSSLTSTQIGKTFAYTGGADGDGVALNSGKALFGSSFSFNGGAGANSINLIAAEDFAILGNLLVINPSQNGTGLNTLGSNGNASFGGSVKIQNGNGAFVNELRGLSTLSIAKGVTISNGNNGEAAATTNTLLGSFVSVGGTVSFTAGSGDTDNNLSAATDLAIAGAVKIKSGNHANGSSDTVISASNLIGVRRGVSILNGSGDDSVKIGVSLATTESILIGGGLIYNGGAGASNLNIAAQQVTVAGSLSATSSGGSALVSIDSSQLQIAKALTAKGSGGDHIVSIKGSGRIGGNVSIDLASDNDSDVSLSASAITPELNIVGNVSIRTTGAGAGTDGITLEKVSAKAISISQSDRNSSIAMQSIRALAAVTVRTGLGVDAASIETLAAVTGVSTFAKAVLIDLGGDNDTLTIGASNANAQAIFESTVTLEGGAGDDTSTVLSGGNVFNLAGQPVVQNFETST
jgi:hypothetical protein